MQPKQKYERCSGCLKSWPVEDLGPYHLCPVCYAFYKVDLKPQAEAVERTVSNEAG